MNKSKKSEANNQQKGQDKNPSKGRMQRNLEELEELSLKSLALVSGAIRQDRTAITITFNDYLIDSY
ncbi:hypothetical protein [Dapis sp. BLCC M172]|uniref:hypothetical protein n=1 Tax=Dapis sp. BLCC M172 TaxID=2975281 RepID=UPI003CF119A7